MAGPLAFSLKEWIEEHRHLLKPPVGNQVVWENTDTIVMIVGGPNKRKDFHINQTEEFFHQLEGDMVLRVKENGEYRDIEIREGDVMLLPPGIPHSPQRGENTVGMSWRESVLQRWRISLSCSVMNAMSRYSTPSFICKTSFAN
jgi:3-hydroxyanthranilate 3,4-dioxygenase